MLRRPPTALLLAILTLTTHTHATVGPPIEIKMSPETRMAVAGEPYEGTLVIRLFESGTLGDFALSGEGWLFDQVEWPEPWQIFQPGTIEVPFSAQPTDANAPLIIAMTIDGRKVEQRYVVGPNHFKRREHRRSAVRVGTDGVAQQLGITNTDVSTEPSASGDAIQLRFMGRIVYDRPGIDRDEDGVLDVEPMTLGVDRLLVRVVDCDPVGTETIWSGVTNPLGFFDSGMISWDDCDITGCDDPDLILEFETDRPEVDVTDNSLTEDTYEWETPEVLNFTGSTYDFGTWSVPEEEMPALHIYSNIIRTHRFILDNTGYNVPKVQVEWPESSGGNAGGFYESFTEEIHMRPAGQWRETTISHEYGHHFFNMFAVNTSPDYCNGYCDGEVPCTSGSDCEDEGHCIWCPENQTDAFNEGWPNWLADVYTRSLTTDYVNFDGTPFEPLYFRSQENVRECCQDDEFGIPLFTEGFVGALLRDIEDDTQDFNIIADRWDSLCLGVDEIFDTVVNASPTTMEQFINFFVITHPEHAPLLYPTAAAISTDFVDFYPDDNTPPNVVQVLDSPTHPLGVGGHLPCVYVGWDHAPDEGRGACSYSYEWSTSPGGVQPDGLSEDLFTIGCQPAAAEFFDLGEYYFSIRTRDCGGNVSDGFATFGPFEVQDCNNSGILDICDTTCGDASYEGCDVGFFCSQFADCGLSEDCNTNLAPDECDLADGTSEDCNESGVPDECEVIFNWEVASGDWSDVLQWTEELLPTGGSDVCVDGPGNVTLTLSEGTHVIDILAVEDNFQMVGNGDPTADLTLNERSWIRGDFTYGGGFANLQIEDRLDIDGRFYWTGSTNSSTPRLRGAGTTYANGGMTQSSVTQINAHRLVLGGATTSDGRFACPSGDSTIELSADATWDHQGAGALMFQCTTSDFIVDGALTKSAPGLTQIDAAMSVSGSIDIEAGELWIHSNGGTFSGAISGADGAEFRLSGGGHEFTTSSSIDVDRFVANLGSPVENFVRGAVNIRSSQTYTNGQRLTFTDEAQVQSYGPEVLIERGQIVFDAVVGGPIQIDTLQLGQNLFNIGNAEFGSGDPVFVDDLITNNGTFRGTSDLTVNNSFDWGLSSFRDPGEVNLLGDTVVRPSGGAKQVDQRTMNNAGTLTFEGGIQLTQEAVLNNTSTGVLDLAIDGTLISGAPNTPINNAGTILKSGTDGFTRLSAPVVNAGLVDVQSGTLEFRQQYTQTDGTLHLNGGDVALWWSNPSIPPMEFNGGTLTGSGSITANTPFDLNNTGSTVSPGSSTGTLFVGGDYNQSNAGVLDIEIGNGGQHDQLEVLDHVTLGGTLNVTTIDGYTPQDGDGFVILTAANIQGTFDTVTIPPQFELDYDATEVRLYAPLFGDIDESGNLDVLDYGAFQTCFAGPDAPPSGGCIKDADGDLDNDGDVDLDDYGILYSLTIMP